MSAVKIIFKRSSVPGKRPTSANLDPGEIGLNTDSNDPGLFFEVNNDTVVKVGPTSVLPEAPTSNPSKGEMWVSTQTGTLNVGVYKDSTAQWQAIAAPYLGGGGNVVFVAPEFPGSTDSILNDGKALPYQTITRAILELSKLTVQAVVSGVPSSSENGKYTIYYAPSRLTANNGRGKDVYTFNVNFDQDPYAQVTSEQLTQFNTPTGGVIIPRGISIVGLDLKKCLISPTYVPHYKHPSYPSGAENDFNEPITSVFKYSGNTYLTNFSVVDKIDYREVNKIDYEDGGPAVFHSSRPHGLELNDKVEVSFSSKVDQQQATFTDGTYYAKPVDTFSFKLTDLPQTDPNNVDIQYSAVPKIPESINIIFTVTNELKSAHRLRGFENASVAELSDYYTKVQKAFPGFFAGQVTDGSEIVSQAEYVIVAPTNIAYPNNLDSNSTRNSSAYANEVNVRSDYGMCWGEVDGSELKGFKSLIANACTCVSLQNDPAAYEVYTTLVNPSTGFAEQKWWSLADATYLSLPLSERPGVVYKVSAKDQLNLLNQTKIKNIRYYYRNQKISGDKSIGIVDIDSDFRHFGFRVRNGAYAQLQSIYTIGCAVGSWALNGGTISLTNSTSNFGSIAIRSEGFTGINTVGGAEPNLTGYLFEGIQRPLALNRSQVILNNNKIILSLGASITEVALDPEDPSIQIIQLSSSFSPCYVLPYTLEPGSAVWVDNLETGETYRAFFAVDGKPTVVPGSDPLKPTSALRVRASDSNIPNAISQTGTRIPYIRRFYDPRGDFERSYSFKVSNTYPTVIPPQVGAVLRLNQINQSINPGTLRPNVQLDPGELGGWGRIFTVDQVYTASLAESPQFNYVVGDSNENVNYYFSATVSDYARPWKQEFNNATGSLVTYQERNWYAAENNYWNTVYYGESSSFRESAGPFKIAPTESCSPFVDTAVLERQDLVTDTYQGSYAKDPYVSGDTYSEADTYLRGSTYPYPTYSVNSYFNDDDSSESLGICLTDIPSSKVISTTSSVTVIQTEQQAGNLSRYRPEIVRFSVSSPAFIPSPKSNVSVLKFSAGADSEFFRVISVSGFTVEAIRLNRTNSYYPNPTTVGKVWPSGTVANVCQSNLIPNVETYDPVWSNTKQAVLRFLTIMGYTENEILSVLTPKYWGERFLPIKSLPYVPTNGYALVTERWPLEFNLPSTIIANTHTWAYVGYLDYSRGLPKFQNNDFSRKLSADYQATVSWGGRVTITGVDDKGEIILFGPEKQALTGRFYEQISPINFNRAQATNFPGPVEPTYDVVYLDDISPQFNGIQTTFTLQSLGINLSASTLPSELLLFIGGGVQDTPAAFTWNAATSQVTFTSPPSAGSYFVGWSSREAINLDNISSQFDGSKTIFTLKSAGANLSASTLSSSLMIWIGGASQSAPSSYSWNASSSQITFSSPPQTGSYFVGWVPKLPLQIDDISSQFNGVKTEFVLESDGNSLPLTATTYGLVLTVGGAIQNPGLNFNFDAETSTITFATPPPALTYFTGWYLGPATGSYIPPIQTSNVVYLDDISSQFNGVQTTFTLKSQNVILSDQTSSSDLLLFVGGSVQDSPAVFTWDGTSSQVTFSSAPSAGDYFAGWASLRSTRIDDISSLFDGSQITFQLKTSGNPLPSDFTSGDLMLWVGGAIQTSPTAFSWNSTTSEVTFSSAPAAGSYFAGWAPLLPSIIDDISPQFNGSQTVFTLNSSGSPLPLDSTVYGLVLMVGGSVQTPGTSFTYSSSTSQITFTDAPAPGQYFAGWYLGPATGSSATITEFGSLDDIGPQFNSSQTTFTLQANGLNLPGTTASSDLLLFTGGGVQDTPASFTWNAGTSQVTFTSSPTSGNYFAGWVSPGSLDIDDISLLFNGVQTTFTLQENGVNLPSSTSVSELMLWVGGAIQTPADSFTWDPITSQVTFSSAPVSGNYFTGWVPAQSSLIDDISSQFNGVQTTFTVQQGGTNLASSVTASELILFVGGAVQTAGTSFTWNPTFSQVTFSSAPASGDYFVGWSLT